MKIIVDAFGGDNAPLEILKGCAQAVEELGVEILLTGRTGTIVDVAQKNGISLSHMEIADAPDVMDMNTAGTEILKSGKHSSMAVGLQKLAEGAGDAFLSAGNSGALTAGGDVPCQAHQGCQAHRVRTGYAERGRLLYAD